MAVYFTVWCPLFKFLLTYVATHHWHDGVWALLPPSRQPPRDSRLSAKWPGLPNSAGASDVIDEMEREVYASARAKLDLKRVVESTSMYGSSSERSSSPASSLSPAASSPSGGGDSLPSRTSPHRAALLASPWQVSLASATAVSAFVLATAGANVPIAAAVFVAVFFIANGDPLEEEGAAGATARLVGRLTIQSVESSKPKLKALARAAITDEEEIDLLRQQIRALEEENAKLALWREQRIAVDESLPKYTMDELKELARQKKLPVGGTKSQLLMRLVENEAIGM